MQPAGGIISCGREGERKTNNSSGHPARPDSTHRSTRGYEAVWREEGRPTTTAVGAQRRRGGVEWRRKEGCPAASSRWGRFETATIYPNNTRQAHPSMAAALKWREEERGRVRQAGEAKTGYNEQCGVARKRKKGRAEGGDAPGHGIIVVGVKSGRGVGPIVSEPLKLPSPSVHAGGARAAGGGGGEGGAGAFLRLCHESRGDGGERRGGCRLGRLLRGLCRRQRSRRGTNSPQVTSDK